jgi:putative MATE family efflux protein
MKKYFDLFLKALKGTEENITEGSINRALFLLAIPMILEMAMEALFAIVDIFFISQLDSDEAIATIGLTETFMFIIISVAMGIGSASTAMVARRIGEGDKENANVAAAHSIYLTTIISLILGVVGFFYAEDLLRMMGGSEKLIEEGVIYTRIILTFNIVLVFLFNLNAIFRGAGNASIAMRTLWLANGINIILDPCLIFGLWIFPELGIKGAAIATCIGRGIGVLYQIWHLTNGKAIVKVMWRHFIWSQKTFKRLVHISIGGTGQHFITTLSWVFLIKIIAGFGSEALAGYTIGIRVIIFTILPSWGLAMAAATLVGQNLGAGKPDRAEKSAWKASFYNMYFLFFLSVMFLFFANPVIELFSSSEEVIKNGVLAVRIISAGYIFFAFEMVLGQSFNGAGDTYTPTLLNFISFWLIQIPLAYLLAITFNFGPTGVYIAIAISSSILAILAIIIFRRGKWKLVKV